MDPKADEADQESWSTYQYAFNNPIRYNDPEGDFVFVVPLVYYAVVAVAAVVVTYQAKRTIDATVGYIQQSNKNSTSTTESNSQTKPRGSNNEKTNSAAKTGQEAHRQEQEKLKAEGAETEVPLTLKDGTKVRKDAVLPDGTAVIIKPDTPSGKKSAEKREKLMKDNDYKTKKIFYDPKDPKYQPGSPTYLGPKK